MKQITATAIILAGGKSSRMKQDKALMTISSCSLIEATIVQIKDLFPEILISSSEIEKYKFLGYRIIPDEKPDEGPLMAILSSLRESSNELNIILACDIPEIDINFLKKLFSYTEGHDIVVPGYKDGKYEALFAIYNKNIIPVIEKQLSKGIRKISSLFPICRTKTVEMDNEKWFKNLNTIEDYKTYMKERNL
jgi:molybdopterin-guanine dinucleotide biosynthesis protein A